MLDNAQGVLAAMLLLISTVVPTAATATGSPELQLATAGGCGRDVLVPPSDLSLAIVVSATGLPAEGDFSVLISLTKASGQRFSLSTTLSDTVPERTLMLQVGPFPPGAIILEARMPAFQLMVTCTVTAGDEVPLTETPTPTRSPTPTDGVPTVTTTPSSTPTFTPTLSLPPATFTATPSETVVPSQTLTPSETATTTSTPSPSATGQPADGAGDANCDGLLSAADLSRQVGLIASGERAACGLDDADGDGDLTAADIDALIEHLFAT